jgi:hypothetical protein
MNAVGRALMRAVPLMTDRRVLALVLAPLAAAMVLWLLVAFAFWAPLRDALAAVIARGITALGLMADPGWVAAAGGSVTAFVLLTLVVGALLLAAIAVFAAPVFVRAVEARHFPLLERKHGGTVVGGVANALIAIALWLPMWLVVLPFLLVPVIGVPLSLLQSAWLNQRLFRYDALAEHASALERAAILRAARRRLLALGLAVAPLSFIPVVNLLSPLYAGLAFTCLCLDELAALRATAAAAKF